jgi:hypothetical protein
MNPQDNPFWPKQGAYRVIFTQTFAVNKTTAARGSRNFHYFASK